MYKVVYVRAHAVDRSCSRVNLDEDAAVVRRHLSAAFSFHDVTLSRRAVHSPSMSGDGHAVTILHIASHGNPHGVVIDGDDGPHIMTQHDIRGLASHYAPSLLVLASRSEPGLALAQSVAGTMVRHVVVISACLGSSTAFVHRLYESLASGLDLASSFSCAEFYLRSIADAAGHSEEPCSAALLPGASVSCHKGFVIRGAIPARAARAHDAPHCWLPALPFGYHREAMVSKVFEVVDALNTYGAKLVIIAGRTLGVGCSTVALDAAHYMSERGCFPGGALWVAARVDASTTLLQQVGRAIGVFSTSYEPSVSAQRARDDEKAVIAALSCCSQRTLLVLDGLILLNPQSCDCIAGGEPCGSATCSPDVASISRILRASDHLVAVVTTTLVAGCGDVAVPLSSVVSLKLARPTRSSRDTVVGYVNVSNLMGFTQCFVLQSLLKARYGNASVPPPEEWDRLVHLESAAAGLASLRKGIDDDPDSSAIARLLKHDPFDLSLQGFCDGFDALANPRRRGCAPDRPPAISIPFEAMDPKKYLQDEVYSRCLCVTALGGNLAALSLFADRVQDTRLFHVPPGVAMACAEEAVAPASLRRPTYAAPPPLTAADRAALWPALSLCDSTGTSTAAALATPPLLRESTALLPAGIAAAARSPAGEASVPVPPPPLVAPRLAACPTDVGDPTPVCHAEAVTLAPSLLTVAAAGAVSAAGSARASGGTARGGTASRPPPSSPSAPPSPSLDDLLDLNASKADVIAALRAVRRDGAFVISGSERRASEGGLKLTFLTAAGSPPTLKLRLLRIDCVSGPRALAAGLPADDATGSASGGSGRLYRVVTGSEEDPSGTPGPALPVAVPAPAPQAAGASVRHGPTQAGSGSHGVVRIPGLPVASSRQPHPGTAEEEIAASTSESTQASATGSGDASTLPGQGCTTGGYSLGALLAGLTSLREAVVVRPPPDGASRKVVPKSTLVALLQADVRYF